MIIVETAKTFFNYHGNTIFFLKKELSIINFFVPLAPIMRNLFRNIVLLLAAAVVISGCRNKQPKAQAVAGVTAADSLVVVSVKYATGFTVKDSAGMRLVSIERQDMGTHRKGGMHRTHNSHSKHGKHAESMGSYHFALVSADDVQVPEGYTKVRVPIERTLCMTALQLSNFTVLDALDVVRGITGTKNMFNKDVLQRVEDGRMVKIGMEGEFDTELVLAAHPDVIFISPFKRGGYDAIKETGITLIPHLGYKELHPLGQAEWIKLVGMFIGKEQLANEVFSGIEKRYNELKKKAANVKYRPTVTSGEMHYGTWRAVGGKNYLAQIFHDAGADYVVKDEETAGENLEFEKMYALSANADFWRILNSYPGTFGYDELKAAEPRNALFKAFRERKVIYCNMRKTPYYEISPVEPDVLLKDFVAIFHPELVEEGYTPKYYKLLK